MVKHAKVDVKPSIVKRIGEGQCSPRSVSNNETELDTVRVEKEKLAIALDAIGQDANQIIKEKFELVWYAENRCRFPTSEHSRRIEETPQYKDLIEDLRGPDGDYHHGFNCGLLAAARLFRSHSEMNDTKEGSSLKCKLDSNVDPHGWDEINNA